MGKFLEFFSLSFQNECSFVSLRDVERAMKVIMWFHANSELIQQVMEDDAREEKSDSSEESSDYDSDEDEIRGVEQVEQVRFLI